MGHRRDMAARRGQSPEVLWSFLPRRRRYGGEGTFGSTTVKVDPLPISEATSMAPPWALTTFFANARPSPVPCSLGLVVKKGWNSFSMTSGGIPGPVSWTTNATVSPRSSSRTVTTPVDVGDDRMARELLPQLDAVAEVRIHLFERGVHDRAEVRLDRLNRRRARQPCEVLEDRRDESSLGIDLLEAADDFRVLRALRRGRGEQGDVCERRVDLVGHVARQSAHCRQSFRLEESTFEVLLLGDVHGCGEHGPMRAEGERLDRDDHVAGLSGFRLNGEFEISHRLAAAHPLNDRFRSPRILPEAEFERGAADHLLARVFEQTQERFIGIDEPILGQRRKGHRDGAPIERLLESFLPIPAARLHLLLRADVAGKSDERWRLSGDPRDREFDGELGAVLPEPREFDASSQERSFAGLQVPREPAAVRVPQ